MSEDLQGLLEKINRDGIEKANATADKIISDAKAKAAEIVKAAKDEADAMKKSSEKAAEDYASRARETVAQASRDTILKIESSVTALLENLLVKNVNAALSNEKVVSELILETLRSLAGTSEVAVPEKLAPALKAQLANEKNLTVVTDNSLGTGFSVRIDAGRIEHAFTGKVVSEELAKRLRPDLANLLK